MNFSCRLFASFLILIASINLTQSQGLGNSPYSRYGIGDETSRAGFRSESLGGTSIANPDIRFVNFGNPALLTFNNVVAFEAGITFRNSSLETNTESQSTNGALPSYAVLTFPITPKWTAAFGIKPKSVISFERRYNNVSVGDTSTQLSIIEKGEGGINTLFLSQGFEISKNFHLGGELSYNFGNRIVKSTFGLNEVFGNNTNVLYERHNYRNWNYNLGAYYQIPLDSGKYNLGLGLTFKGSEDYATDVFISRQFYSGQFLASEDTFIQRDGQLNIPLRANFGISLSMPNSWSIALEANYQPWTEFSSDIAMPKGIDALGYGLGIEWTPNYRSISSPFARSIYRFGVYQKPQPFNILNTTFNEVGMNIGLSIPVKKITFINMAITAGRRGTLSNDLIRENFAQLTFGLTLNDTGWFKRYKLD